jgi:hypothetical protein
LTDRQRSAVTSPSLQVCTDWLNGLPVAQTAGLCGRTSSNGRRGGFDAAVAVQDRHAALAAWLTNALRDAPGGGGGGEATALRDTVVAAAAIVAAGKAGALDELAAGGSGDLLRALAPPSIAASAEMDGNSDEPRAPDAAAQARGRGFLETIARLA